MQPGVIRMSQTAGVLPGRFYLTAGPLTPSCLCQLDSADWPVRLAPFRKGCGQARKGARPSPLEMFIRHTWRALV